MGKYFNRTTSENAQEVLEESHHSEYGDNLGNQTDDVRPDSQNGALCTAKCHESEYLGQFSPMKITYNHSRSFPQVSVMGHGFLSSTAKE